MAKRTNASLFTMWTHQRFIISLVFIVQICLLNNRSTFAEGEKILDNTTPNEKDEVSPTQQQSSTINAAGNTRKTPQQPQIPPNNLILPPVMRIVGGKRVPKNKYPFMTALFQQSNNDPTKFVYRCGGTLLAPNVILSAAHCREKAQFAHIGKRHMYDPTEVYETFEIVEKKVHPLYDQKSFVYDFALFKLNGTSSYPTIQVHDRDYANRNMSVPGTTLTVLGWGKESSGGENTVSLHEADVSLWNLEDCVASYGGNRFGDFTMCASEPGVRDSCQGDSGGPLIYSQEDGGGGAALVQVGIVSWGRDCGLAPYPGVYAKISAAFEWIQESLCLLSPDSCGGIAASRPPDTTTDDELPKGDAGGNAVSGGDSCVDAVGEFVVEDVRKRKRFVRSCEWVKERWEKECFMYKQWCPQTCGHITECPSEVTE